jgi:dipeptidyl aminopeptidase/acylaminoacyl peptidase
MFRVFVSLAVAWLMTPLAPVRSEPQPPIPCRVLFGTPVKSSPQISPDGKHLAYLAPDEKNVLQVWVQTLGKDDAMPVTAEMKRGIISYTWTYAPDTLLYIQDNDGDENYHIYSIRFREGMIRNLTPFPGVRAQFLGVHPDFPSEILVGLNPQNHQPLHVYRIDLSTGAIVLDTQNPGDVIAWQFDAKFRVRAAVAATPDGGREVRCRADEKSAWRNIVRWGMDDADGRLVGFTADGRCLWMLSNAHRDTLSLTKRDLETGEETVLAADDRADVSQVIFNPKTYEVEAVAFSRKRLRWRVISPRIADDLKALELEKLGEPLVVSQDSDLKTWVVAFSSDVRPTTYYLYNRQAKKLQLLFASQPELYRYTLAPMRPVIIKSRDGLDLVSYLTLSEEVKPRRLPMVLLVHGGPWTRDYWGFNAQAQWLANRGYAVLSVNYRGSAGFGKKFLRAGFREWGGKMHDDLIDAVNWAVKEGYADPKRVAIFGCSYGGYAALVGANFTPEVFACAIDVGGPSNLVTLLQSIPPSWEPLRKLFTVRVGNVQTEEEFLKSRSPLFQASRIKIPVLIAQGANDPRVRRSESDQMAGALRRAGRPVEYLLFADEGHGLVRTENRLLFYEAAEAFLAKHLGGGTNR